MSNSELLTFVRVVWCWAGSLREAYQSLVADSEQEITNKAEGIGGWLMTVRVALHIAIWSIV